jgi:hypothetical protein
MRLAITPFVILLAISTCIAAENGRAASSKMLTTSADVCVYGGTSGGVFAAVQAAKMGKSVVLIEPTKHLGGLTSGGLGWADVGLEESIGGMTRQYFHRVWQHYQRDEAWKWCKKHQIEAQHEKRAPNDETMWIFEPHVAEQLFDEMAAEAKVAVVRGERLYRKGGVSRDGARIASIRMESGRTFAAKMFLDATYEGDLMAAAGVSYTVGREANSQYNETLNGRRPVQELGFMERSIDPYVRQGDPTSGLLPRVHPAPSNQPGSADRLVQAYCYRMCLTDVPENRVMIEKPAGYDEREFELVFRALEAGQSHERFFKFSEMPNRKTDSNNHSSISTDLIGGSYDYPEADYAIRERIANAHERWQRGMVWTLQNHPRVPASVREYFKPWGLPKDEFTDNHNWTPALYVREARRMVGQYVVTEHDCLNHRRAEDSVGLGSYTIDSHLVQYILDDHHKLAAEGNMGVHLPAPYAVSYRALVPKRGECTNLLVPVCLSASHVGYSTIRMEPAFMILGQSAGTAAAMALDEGVGVQQVDYAKLRRRLLADGQRL